MFTFLQALLVGASASAPLSQATLAPISGMSIWAMEISPQNAYTFFKLDSDGHLYYLYGGTKDAYGMYQYVDAGLWLLAGVNTAYEVRFTQVSGQAPTTGTLNTWQALSTDRELGYTITTNGYSSKIGVFTIEIRRVSDSVVVASATVDMDCSVEI